MKNIITILSLVFVIACESHDFPGANNYEEDLKKEHLFFAYNGSYLLSVEDPENDKKSMYVQYSENEAKNTMEQYLRFNNESIVIIMANNCDSLKELKKFISGNLAELRERSNSGDSILI